MNGIFYKDKDNDYVLMNDEHRTIHIIDNTMNAIHGDTVLITIENNKPIISKIIQRNQNKIIGVLSLSSKITLSLTKKNVPKKKFIPFDSVYPHFSVSTKKAGQSTDSYAIIKINDWLPKSKYPDGIMERIIGKIGDNDVEKECLKIRYGLNWKKYRKNDYMQTNTCKRIDMTEIDCFSIDPPGCQDIDDVLHYRYIDIHQFEIGIHIADVSSIVEKDSPLDTQMKSRGESIYFPFEQINMMPQELATDKCSLLENKTRNAFSVIVQFSHDLDIIDIKFVKTSIINKKAMSYDEAQQMIHGSHNDSLNSLYKVGKQMYDKNIGNRLLLENKTYDMHTMVEMFMVFANVQVASKLTESIPSKSIIRSHKGIKDNEMLLDYDNSDPHITNAIKTINTMKMERATYQLYDANDDNKHTGLGEITYTHFTSPIRRYFDIVVHRLLWDLISTDTSNNNKQQYTSIELTNLCDHLNSCHKTISNAQRESIILQTIFNFYDDYPVLETSAYVTDISDNRISIYVPKIKLNIDINIIPTKLIHLVVIESYDNSVTLHNKNNDMMIIKLLDKICVRIVMSKKEPYVKNKILVEILNPNPILFCNCS
jgi:exosome complex exonuclease DIS3/RRP44